MTQNQQKPIEYVNMIGLSEPFYIVVIPRNSIDVNGNVVKMGPPMYVRGKKCPITGNIVPL